MGSPAASADIGALGAPPLSFLTVRLTQETAMADTSSSAGKPIAVPVSVQLTGAQADDKLDNLSAVLFDRLGQLVSSTSLKLSRKGDLLLAQGRIDARPEQLQSARLVVAPVPAESATAVLTRKAMERQLGAWTEPLQINTRRPQIDILIPRPGWIRWPRLCVCWVRGKLVKRVRLPDGQLLDLPICHARVTICEVDRWRLIIDRLPWADLLRLREDLLDLIRDPRPIPEPDPEPWFHPLTGPLVQPLPDPAPLAARLAPQQLEAANLPVGLALRAAPFSVQAQADLGTLQLRNASATLLRADLLAHLELLRPYFCWLPWLEPWFIYTKQCFGPVATDEQGRFAYPYVHLCSDTDQPDIYISAEQRIGGTWTTIHQPPVRCHTIWNYTCGDEITVVVSDPRAQPCIPDVPTVPPGGVDRWVMPMAIGGTWIRGTAASGTTPAGWVRPDGYTDHGTVLRAPFGATLGFRQQHALSIPNQGAGGQYYYRWSVRKGNSGDWTLLLDPVARSYVRDLPGPDVEFPQVLLGPQPNNLFRFKPVLFSPADWGVSTATDPAGTSYYWPVDNSIGDIYAARWTTPGTTQPAAAAAAAGSYQVRLEVFDSTGASVAPGAATFSFVVPSHFVGDTLHTRVASASERDGNGFVFTVQVDNTRCSAVMHPPTLSTGVGVDDCGFLRYTPGSSLTLAFDATHPNGHATFGFSLVRGAFGVGSAGASGEVTALSAGSYTGDGAGRFSHAFPVIQLLGPLPPVHPGSCANAAFAESLQVYAKATDGNSRIEAYDAGGLRAFALAQP
jgi:hypothetical protein